MKKVVITVIVVAAAAIAVSAFAGLTVNTGGLKKAATETATTTAANAKLGKYKCEWNPTSSSLKEGCDLTEIAAVYAAQTEACKRGGGSCTAVINTNDSRAYNYVRGKLNLTGTWRVRKGTGTQNTITFAAE